ncbi:MAG: hypothetical protein CO135_03405 [Candidatus Levybacteria bacterium CG_4_9_14_3_um_filter_35_16]|nr:MAG: hypothetical protein COW87_03415 [Candidatus Levybacteria bacterium CG22_combo_CG10-13_8_21_14_all_35_11]PJA91024.1 MAG: hypothetical protein CO135_03405 [Candidatus Levybacteria bacterium CG_4_9_14_3_um_filter_35_16]PJC54739.1 MAG: hypothetical protein CO028_00835 [Candidatus Levybacteria bacterium CG_4_9_14_0_2_um_filter_35_21]
MNAQLKSLLKTLDESYIKTPALPKQWKDLLVNFAPWLALLGGIILVFGAISLLGLGSFLSPFAMLTGVGAFAVTWLIAAILLLVGGLMELLAFSPLKARKEKGWNLMFYALLLNALSSVVRLNISDIVMAILGFLIGYYFLYQVKSSYK